MQKSEIDINLAFLLVFFRLIQHNICRILFSFKILPENLEKQS